MPAAIGEDFQEKVDLGEWVKIKWTEKSEKRPSGVNVK
jgi:hypothetical protein